MYHIKTRFHICNYYSLVVLQDKSFKKYSPNVPLWLVVIRSVSLWCNPHKICILHSWRIDYLSEQILTLQIYASFWFQWNLHLPTCKPQLHKTKVSERLKVKNKIIYINGKPTMLKGFHRAWQIIVISKLPEENVTAA